MRWGRILFSLGVSASLVFACGGRGKNFAGFDDSVPADAGDGGAPSFTPFSEDGAAKQPCVGLQCKRVACGGTTEPTSVSGVIWDPAGKNPLYNVIVYVPNAELEPMKHGVSCETCAGVSGSPIATALTDATGAFTLRDVPVMDDMPLVIQIGKWRRQVTIPRITECVENKLTDKDRLRLPRTQSEGDMPKIALTGGCDPIHTFIQKIGIAASELTDKNGKGTVHVYRGNGSGDTGGVPTATDAYAFYGSFAELSKYDIVINECECSPYPRDRVGNGYTALAQYLNAGGRVFNSHYHLNFLGENGKADINFLTAAEWTLWGGASGGAPWLLDTSFPKGKALSEWMENLKVASAWSPKPKTSPPGQIASNFVGDIRAAKPGLSQRWIYSSTGSSVGYLSINAPVTAKPEERCGRAVLTDLHVGSSSLTTMTEAEAALEFILFDLSACVIDDSKPPVPPPVK